MTSRWMTLLLMTRLPAAVLALVAASEDWRSPFYVLMLTALVLPSTGLAFRRALGWGIAFALAYLGDDRREAVDRPRAGRARHQRRAVTLDGPRRKELAA